MWVTEMYDTSSPWRPAGQPPWPTSMRRARLAGTSHVLRVVVLLQATPGAMSMALEHAGAATSSWRTVTGEALRDNVRSHGPNMVQGAEEALGVLFLGGRRRRRRQSLGTGGGKGFCPWVVGFSTMKSCTDELPRMAMLCCCQSQLMWSGTVWPA